MKFHTIMLAEDIQENICYEFEIPELSHIHPMQISRELPHLVKDLLTVDASPHDAGVMVIYDIPETETSSPMTSLRARLFLVCLEPFLIKLLKKTFL